MYPFLFGFFLWERPRKFFKFNVLRFSLEKLFFQKFSQSEFSGRGVRPLPQTQELFF